MVNDKVSVIIPVYNSEEFLHDSINSVLNQTHKNLEIIAINDGSTDKSLEILQQFSDKIIVISQPNQGLASTIKTGIKKMHGKWFKWFSPDDILYPNAIEILVKETNKLPENTIVYSNWEIIDENSEKTRDFSESNFNDLEKFDFNVRLLDGQQINVNTTLIPKSLFSKGCLIRNIEDQVAIDYDFFLRAAILFDARFFLIEKPLVKYRVHSNQLSNKKITKTLSYLDELRHEVLSNIDENTKKRYNDELKKYRKQKPIAKKSMQTGLKLLSSILPKSTTNKLLVFYLNKIRSSR